MEIDKIEYLPSNPIIVEEALKLAGIRTGKDVFMEPGCGDGRALIKSVQPPYSAKHAVGIEVNSTMAQIASDNVRRLGLRNKIEIINGNLFEQDMSRADVVFTYLGKLNEKLKPKLRKELKPEARIVSHCYKYKGWNYSNVVKVVAPLGDTTEPLMLRPVFLYRMNEIY